jgi:hypothetical protein
MPGMSEPQQPDSKQPRWLLLLLWPLSLLVALPILLPLGVLALLSIPYFAVYPDHHAHLWDFEGTADQKEFLALRRRRYRSIGLRRRIRRAFRFKGYARLTAHGWRNDESSFRSREPHPPPAVSVFEFPAATALQRKGR